TLRVAGQAAARTKLGEVLAPRQQLVHIRLVPRVPHDRVVRRVEDAMQGDRQLDDTEVRPQVTACLGNVLDEELPYLARELGELALRQAVEIARPRDRLKQTHSFERTPPVLETGGTRRGPSRRYDGRGLVCSEVVRPANGGRTAGCRRCGSSRPHRGCRYGRPHRTPPSACPRASARSAGRSRAPSWGSRRCSAP